MSSQLFLTHVLTKILRLNWWINIGRKSKYISKYSVWRLNLSPTSPLIGQLSVGWRHVWVCHAVSTVSRVSLLRPVFLTFNRFSIWSSYLSEFFYHTLKESFELWYYLCKKSICQKVIEISGVNVACAFLHKEIFNPKGSRTIWWRGY